MVNDVRARLAEALTSIGWNGELGPSITWIGPIELNKLVNVLAPAVAGLIPTRICMRCQRTFVRSGRATYCSKACSNRQRAARHYAKTRQA